jgi:hypothetical protein
MFWVTKWIMYPLYLGRTTVVGEDWSSENGGVKDSVLLEYDTVLFSK